MTEYRIEKDSLGDVEVPLNAYWGAQTQRSLINFPIGGETVPVPVVRALGAINEHGTLSRRQNSD